MQIMTYGNVNFECVCKIHQNVHPSGFTLYFAHKRLVANLMNGVQVVVVNTLLPLSFIAAPSFDFSIYVALETSLDVKYLRRVLTNLNIKLFDGILKAKYHQVLTVLYPSIGLQDCV